MKTIFKIIMILSLIVNSNFISAQQQQHVEDYMFDIPASRIQYKMNKKKRNVKIHSFYISQHPESIGQYRLYLNELTASDSTNVKGALPKEAVLKSCGLKQEEVNFIIEEYFGSDDYNHYPVVGLEYAQIQRYLNWKTDRVGKQVLRNINFEFNDAESYIEIVKSSKNPMAIPVQLDFRLCLESELISAYITKKTVNVMVINDSKEANKKIHPVLKKLNIKDIFQYNIIDKENYKKLDEVIFDMTREEEIVVKNIHFKKARKYCSTTKDKSVYLKPWRVTTIKI